MATEAHPERHGKRGVRWTLPRMLLLAISIALCLAAGGIAWLWLRLEPLSLARAEALSVVVLDRDDRLLRAYAAPDGRWRLPVEIKDVDPRYLGMLIAYEDRRFRQHPGVDAWAIARAGWLALRHGRVLSGGSTLTMQVARLLLGVHERSLWGKIKQALLALSLERRLSKDEILAIYLRLAPFGGNLEGVRAASLAYFGKEPRRLSVAEAALLVAIPQSPQARRPDRFPAAARRARNHVLARMVAAGVISREEAARAAAEPMTIARREFPMLAPHVADAEVAQHPGRVVHRLTLERARQANLEALVRDYVATLEGKLSAAVVVVDHRTGEVVAHVGSPGLLDLGRYGAIDMASALRSPGSTLKPIIYGLAFELGLAHPETLIEDAPARFGLYVPKNFDSDWHGTVTIRGALIHSLNIPAVKVLEAVGAGRLSSRIRQAGVEPVLPKGADPSLAMALGGVGLRLTDLAQLYAAIARGGEPVPLQYRRDPATGAPPRTPAGGPRLLSPVAAWYIQDILCRAIPPANAKPGTVCYKTGTSYGFRDAWSVGFDGRHVVAVWVGRADGASVPGLSGRTSAAPLLFDAFARLSLKRTPMPAAPSGVLRVSTSELPPPLKRFRERTADEGAAGASTLAVAIAFPPDRAEIEVDEAADGGVIVKAEGGALPLTWLLDGEPIASDPARREAELPAGRRGFFRLSVVDANGRTDRVFVRLK